MGAEHPGWLRIVGVEPSLAVSAGKAGANVENG
jgi:hypothetical protein